MGIYQVLLRCECKVESDIDQYGFPGIPLNEKGYAHTQINCISASVRFMAVDGEGGSAGKMGMMTASVISETVLEISEGDCFVLKTPATGIQIGICRVSEVLKSGLVEV